jgi:hypothetical protein
LEGKTPYSSHPVSVFPIGLLVYPQTSFSEGFDIEKDEIEGDDIERDDNERGEIEGDDIERDVLEEDVKVIEGVDIERGEIDRDYIEGFDFEGFVIAKNKGAFLLFIIHFDDVEGIDFDRGLLMDEDRDLRGCFY